MNVIFSHGKESGPWGSKIKALANVAKDKGHHVESIDYSGIMDPDERVKKLNSVVANCTAPIILVGSSMGGYVSLVTSDKMACNSLFLLAPALYMPGYLVQEYRSTSNNICVVHGKSDDVIPYQNSQRLANEIACDIHLIDGDHRLNSSLDKVIEIFSEFLAPLN